jgi:hypothetical protein
MIDMFETYVFMEPEIKEFLTALVEAGHSVVNYGLRWHIDGHDAPLNAEEDGARVYTETGSLDAALLAMFTPRFGYADLDVSIPNITEDAGDMVYVYSVWDGYVWVIWYVNGEPVRARIAKDQFLNTYTWSGDIKWKKKEVANQ